MKPAHNRYEDQGGFGSKLKWIATHPSIQGAMGALIIAFILWISGVFSNFPNTYAQKVDLSNLAARHDVDYKYLDERKLDKTDYQREHAALEDRMNARFDKTDKANDKIFDIVWKIHTNQQVQYKKVNARTDKIDRENK